MAKKIDALNYFLCTIFKLPIFVVIIFKLMHQNKIIKKIDASTLKVNNYDASRVM
jgi:hypothetical protein